MRDRFDFSLWGRAMRQPQAIGALLISLISSAGLLPGAVGLLGFTGLATVALGVGYVAVIGAAIGLQLLMQSRPAAPKPSDVQTNIRQEISERRRVYWRGLNGSVIVFGFRRGEKTYVLHYICEGPIEGIVSFRLDRKPVTLDEAGFVTDEQYQHGGRSRVQILHTLGLMTDEPFAELLSAFPELDDEAKPFRHRGCVMVLTIFEQVPFDAMTDVYPNNLPGLQVLLDARNDIYDPRDESTGLTGNAGLCLLAECMDVYGLSPEDEGLIDLDAFAAFADHCEEPVGLKAGGTEPRYRCAGTITLGAENEARIAAIASICNADVYIDPRGRLSVRQRLRLTPSIALRERYGDHLTVQMEGGRTGQKKFNRVDVTYVDPLLNFKANNVTWRHAGMIEDDGRDLPQAFQAMLCPSPTQAQRLAKLFLHERNPEFAGSLVSGSQALELLADPVFTLDLSPEDAVERVAIATDGIEMDAGTVTISVSFMVPHADAMAWVPSTDEQDEVVVPPALPSQVDDVGLTVTATVVLLENSAPVLSFSWVAAGEGMLPDSYGQQVQVSPAGVGQWADAVVNQEARTARFGPVADGGAYDWRIRNIASGRTFDWQASVTPVTVTVDPVAPQPLVAASKNGGLHLGGVLFTLTTAAGDSHLARIAVYRRPHGVMLDKAAHFHTRLHGVPAGTTFNWPLGDLTRTSIYADGGFDVPGSHTMTGSWAVTGGKAVKSSGTGGNITQAWSGGSGVVLRGGVVAEVNNQTNTRALRLFGATPVSSTITAGTGPKWATLTTNGDTNAIGFAAGSTTVVTLDDMTWFEETAACTTQGHWDFDFVAENISGIEAAGSPVTVAAIFIR